MITKRIYQPNCGANCSDRWLAEVREDGWLVNYSRHDTAPGAMAWLDKQNGDMSPGVAGLYADVFKNHGR